MRNGPDRTKVECPTCGVPVEANAGEEERTREWLRENCPRSVRGDSDGNELPPFPDYDELEWETLDDGESPFGGDSDG